MALNREILKSVGKRVPFKRQQNPLNEGEQFEPVQQNSNIRSMFDVLDALKPQGEERKANEYQVADYNFDDNNNIDARQPLETPAHMTDDNDNYDDTTTNDNDNENHELAWHMDKLHGIQQLQSVQRQQQQKMHSGRNVYLTRQWNQLSDSDNEPNQQPPQQQQQQQLQTEQQEQLLQQQELQPKQQLQMPQQQKHLFHHLRQQQQQQQQQRNKLFNDGDNFNMQSFEMKK